MARETKKTPVRGGRAWIAAVVVAAVSVSVAVAAGTVHRFLVTSPRFVLSRDDKDAIRIEGLHYAPRSKVLRVFGPDFERSVLAVPLAERRRRLLAIDWVEDASVSRVWPARLVVRIRERRPVAFVFPGPGMVLLIDRAGVLLDPPLEAQFSFPVLRGIREEASEAERRLRVRAFLGLQQDMGPQARDISEVDASDPEDLRVVAQIGQRAVALDMGDADFARRYRNFLNHYPEMLKNAPEVKAFDLRLDDRITAKE